MIGQSIGNAVTPILGSFVVKAAGYEIMFIGAGIVVLAGGLLLLLIQRRLDKKESILRLENI